MKKSSLLLLLSFFISWSAALAQDMRVTGTVTSAEDGVTLPGVSVQIKGTTRGTQTDVSGKYSLDASPNSVLVFSFVGLGTQEVAVGNRSIIDVALSADDRTLSEVVVTGYGTQSKRNLTGNIARVSGAEIQNNPVTTFEQALQGRAAGVQITSLNGKLGQGIQMRIRGSSSVTASNEPLYVLDGIPLTTTNQGTSSAPQNPLADINFNDIESIDILKDASAAAIYGSRASNGVVLITTKKGKTGKTKFNIGYQMGGSTPTNKREWLNTAEYVELFSEAVQNGIDLGYLPSNYLTGSTYSRFTRYAAGDEEGWRSSKFDTDWQEEAFQKAPMGQLDISASGGDAKTRFFVSGQYLDQQGIIIANSFKRLSGRVNLDHKATDKLTLGVNVNIARTVNGRLSNDNAFSTPMQIVALPPMTPIIDPRTNQLSGNYTLYYNPLLNRDFSSNVSTSYRTIGNIFAEYKFNDWLKFRSEWGTDLYTLNEDQYFGKETARNTGAPNGQGFSSFAQITNYTTNNFFSLGKTFAEKHDIDATIGMTFQKSDATYNNVTGLEYPSNAYQKITSAARITGGSSSGSNFSFLSYFGRANYRLADKYLLSVSGRIDGSSRFGANNRYGFFPAASAGWVISEESFMKSLPALSLLKLRASYGLTGNAEIGNFASYGLYSGSSGYAGVPGQSPSQIENPDLRWEQTTQADIGLEFGLFSGRLSGEIDYYIKNTNDLLLNVNVPGTSGFRTQLRNIGSLENKGWEFVLTSENTTGAFKWNTTLNLAANRNKILNLDGQVITGGFINQAVEGQPIGSFFAIEYAGVDVNNGDALYYINDERPDGSRDRNTTNNPNEAQRVVIGNPNPSLIGGITNNISFKGFEFSILFQGQYGNDIFNGGGRFQSANGDFFDNQSRDQLRRWRQPGDVTDVPQARLFDGNGTAQSSRYLQRGDYLRLKNTTLSYNLPSSVTNRLKMDRVRLYVTGQNLLTFTNYTGWDPEVNADYIAGNIGLGNDFYSAPQAKTIIVGINLGF